jgi:protein-disulfide isomerase
MGLGPARWWGSTNAVKCAPVRALIPSVLTLTLAVAGCSGGVLVPDAPPPAPAPAPIAQPGPPGAPPLPAATSEPKPLPGLEKLTLEGREKALFWQLLSQLYAPCPSEAVSLRQCIEETRPCAACTPAAQLLGEKVREGATADEAREVYGERFGPNVKHVDVADSPTLGPADAPVTIMVWSDFECPHCRMALPVIERIVEAHQGQVRLVHKFYPLRQHTHAATSARAAVAAQNQGHYWEMERTLFEHQDEQSDADLDRYARELKLDLKRFHADMSAARTEKILARDHDDAERAGLTGTPFILINGREFDTAHFHVNLDLNAWVTLELELLTKK